MDLTDRQNLTLSPSARLLGLPTELYLDIISYLDLPTTQLLRQTCKHFHTLTPPLDNVNDLLLAEKSETAQARNIFTCVVCKRLRKAGKFADVSRKGRCGRDGDKRVSRFCIDCGVKPPAGSDPKLRYKKGSNWTRFGLPYVYCKSCWIVKRGAKERKDCEVCDQCWKKGKGR